MTTLKQLAESALAVACPTCPAAGKRCREPRHRQGTPGRTNWRTLATPHAARLKTAYEQGGTA